MSQNLIQYMKTNTRKPIFYPSFLLNKTNIIRMEWSRGGYEDHLTKTIIECHQDYDDSNNSIPR